MDPAANKFKPIKIVVIGDGGVGKTSLIKWYIFLYLLFSYIHDQFPEEHVPTVLDCYRTEVHLDNRPLTLQIW